MRFRRPSLPTAIALLALFVALGGPAEAQKLIDGSKLRRGSVTSREVENKSLSRRDITAGTIEALRRTPRRSISGAKLQSDAVTGSKLAPSSVGSTAVADQTLTAVDIQPGSLTSGLLAARSVGFAEMDDSSVGKANLRAGSVGKSELGVKAVGIEEAGGNGVQVTFGSILAGDCASVDAPVAALPDTQLQDLSQSLVLVAQPSTWPGDSVTLSGRGLNATTLRLTACNLGDLPVTPGAQAVPFLALAP